ncbi:hypothetical protein Hbl1158_02330 [Halobaculum sp. CBA1158]|uniref:hypothetical protein n=1 Tax=Halobaculum sp. CBA1158 TaxID=2904243 RepID=UPI001F2D440F|nr:hypothetical protein [Halobaculum sp. CBA1158]UIP01321.1 hypothetical protein Hbl1158_02330 [Halobaculum sp. CBA1158]
MAAKQPTVGIDHTTVVPTNFVPDSDADRDDARSDDSDADRDEAADGEHDEDAGRDA